MAVAERSGGQRNPPMKGARVRVYLEEELPADHPLAKNVNLEDVVISPIWYAQIEDGERTREAIAYIALSGYTYRNGVYYNAKPELVVYDAETERFYLAEDFESVEWVEWGAEEFEEVE